MTACPLLKAAFIESMRLDSATWSLKRLKHDVTISAGTATTGNSEGSDKPASYLLPSGSFIEIPMDQHFSNPRFFDEPGEYRPARHIRRETAADGSSKLTAEWGTIRAFGGGSDMCPGRLYAEREILACTAGLLALWEFEPVEGETWRIPKSKKATGVVMPTEDVRVRIQRREFTSR